MLAGSSVWAGVCMSWGPTPHPYARMRMVELALYWPASALNDAEILKSTVDVTKHGGAWS